LLVLSYKAVAVTHQNCLWQGNMDIH